MLDFSVVNVGVVTVVVVAWLCVVCVSIKCVCRSLVVFFVFLVVFGVCGALELVIICIGDALPCFCCPFCRVMLRVDSADSLRLI